MTVKEIQEIAGGGEAYTELTGTSWDGSRKFKSLTTNTSLTLSSTRTEGLIIIIGNGYTLDINGVSVLLKSGANSTAVGFIRYGTSNYHITSDVTSA